jgi:pilus assembly protein CpaC
MSVGGVQQVMLKVRFAEMQRSVAKSLSSSVSISSGDVQAGTGTWLLQGTDSTNSNSGILVDNDTIGAAAINVGLGSVQVGLLLEALERKGVVRTLAEPNLTALSGQEAKFLAGGEYPVPVAQDSGNITVEFKPFGVELNFIPRVVDGDLINLELNAAVSSIDTTNSLTINNNFTIDAFRRRETSSTVELRDGQSFAIAGLLQDDFTDNNAQVPWLGDIPVLGALFRSADYQRSQSELVIVITAHLVTPTSGEALVLPTDRVKPPSERDLFLFGKIAKDKRPPKGAAGEVAKQDFSGSYGYVMD